MCGMGSPLQRKRGRGTGWVQQIRDGHACLNWAREQSVALPKPNVEPGYRSLGQAGQRELLLFSCGTNASRVCTHQLQLLHSVRACQVADVHAALLVGCIVEPGVVLRAGRGRLEEQRVSVQQQQAARIGTAARQHAASAARQLVHCCRRHAGLLPARLASLSSALKPRMAPLSTSWMPSGTRRGAACCSGDGEAGAGATGGGDELTGGRAGPARGSDRRTALCCGMRKGRARRHASVEPCLVGPLTCGNRTNAELCSPTI